MNRELDGIYFRVKRGNKWENICFSDLTEQELEEITKDKPVDWWKSVAIHLRDCIKQIGDEFNLKGGHIG